MANWRFGAFPKLPYSTMQQLNLDWILDRIRRFLPDTGTKGQVLTRTKDGAAWVDPEAASGAVSSVNGKTGVVVLDAEDVGALPDSYTAPVQSVNGQTGAVVIPAGTTVNVAQYTASVTLSANAKVYQSFNAIALSGKTIIGFALLASPNTDWIISSVRYFAGVNEIRVYMMNTYDGSISGSIILNVSYI